MAQEQGRFSPAQILLAAEKAERDGRMDHAVQFYRYIAEQQSASPEADIARHAMDRLTGVRAPSPAEMRSTGYPSRAPEAHVNGFETPLPPHERTGPPGRNHPSPAARSAAGVAPAPAYGAHDQPQSASGRPPRGEASYSQSRMPVLLRLPQPRRGYRAGRALAMLMTISGGTAILAGMAMLAVTLLAPKELGRLGPEIAGLVGIGGSLGAMVTGAFLLLAGQLARAVFDGANAVRELVSIERMMARHNARTAASQDE